MASYVFALVVLVLASTQAFATDPSQLQDFCVADNTTNVFVNGVVCKNPALVKADDFFFSGLDKTGNTKNALGSKVTAVNVNNLFGLNTLGISLARVDFAPMGSTLHTHTRGSTRRLRHLQPPKLFTKTLNKGDVFVFPQGLIHFQLNIGRENAVAIAALSSQNPGVITVANTVFGSNPAINDDVLAKAFQVDKKVVDHLQSLFWTENH
ncbi:unnamed protein product [Spirodela intermedia]|uniref:Germin-like protein n=1 Tax=Spirodela intermedia TaxID=51605 RepID=A0ABN7ECA5_SPIIN|nr:unnamed protein product [Spirodela intermedia]